MQRVKRSADGAIATAAHIHSMPLLRIGLFWALATSGCAGARSLAGAGGAPAVSGATQDSRAQTGAATDSIATNGSDTTGEAVESTPPR